MNESEEIAWQEKLDSLKRVASYRFLFTIGLIVLGGVTALLEGVGLSFIYPIIEVAQSGGDISTQGRIMPLFLSIYDSFGMPFTLGSLILGISVVMTIRFTASFTVDWLKGILQKRYEAKLRAMALDRALAANIRYFDEEGSDDILNAIITETRYSGRVIRGGVETVQTLFLATVYLGVMLYIAPLMTLFALGLLGGITLVLRNVIEPAYTVGSRVASANERVQQTVQAGTQGIREVKLFGLREEVFEQFSAAIQGYTKSEIDLNRNKAAIQNFYDLAAALSLFALIYVGFAYSGLELGALGIFLFAMFRLSPLVSRLNSQVYNVEGNLSHLVRTQAFLDRLGRWRESGGDRSIGHLDGIEFEEVSFAYGDDEQVFRDLSFRIENDEFIAFVGQSGAGKSTIVSLLAGLYRPDSGRILGNGTPMESFDLEEWRERIAVVRQQPYIFNDTLERNVTVGNRSASREDVEQVCEIARVDEFLPDLPNGYESVLGDDGVRLSGGQRQRVALARALLMDADFLVLDEATSDLDSTLENEVQARIEAMEEEYGIIAIAHRLSTVRNADRIYTLEGGQIVEAGEHAELVGKNGKYAELYAAQTQSS